MRGGPDVPAPDARPLVELDRDDLALVDEQRLGAPVEVEIERAIRTRAAPRPAERPILGGDEAAERGDPEVRQVDPAEQAVPVRIVRLAGIEVVAGDVAAAARRHRLDEVADPEHLLVEVVDLAVLDLEVAPDRPAQPARLGPPGGLGLLDAAAKASASSAGSAHSPISAYEPVGR